MLKNNDLLSNPSYTPAKLFDTLIDKYGLKNDAAIARKIGVDSSQISRVRNKVLPIGAVLLMKMYDEIGIEIRELKRLAGMEGVRV